MDDPALQPRLWIPLSISKRLIGGHRRNEIHVLFEYIDIFETTVANEWTFLSYVSEAFYVLYSTAV